MHPVADTHPLAPRRPTNISLDERLLAEAREYEVDLSCAAEAGIAQAIAERKAEQWQRENRAALDSSNAWVERKGLPLAGYRAF